MLEAFGDSIGSLSRKSQAIYLRAAKRVLVYCGFGDNKESSPEQVLKVLETMPREEKQKRFGRVHRFEAFLHGIVYSVNDSRISKTMELLQRLQYKPLGGMSAIRDCAILGVWVTIGKGRGVSEVTLDEVHDISSGLCIGRKKAEPVADRAIRRWLQIRSRAIRPEQYRIFRRSKRWAESPLLFPGADGKKLSRMALYNALRRFQSKDVSEN